MNRTTATAVFKGKKPEKKQEAVRQYLDLIDGLSRRFKETIKNTAAQSEKQCVLLLLLKFYNEYLEKFIDQIDRRLLQSQQIPQEEKVFSIFEPETEWINKGKQHPNVELGKLVLITSDQHQFIVDYKVMEKETDSSQVEGVSERTTELYPNQQIDSHSLDKGFYSKDNYKILKDSKVALVVLPKKGKPNKEEKERESDEKFIELRHRHSAVESNINSLEHHGLNRCPDKGLPKLKRYVGLCILAYNLHILGKHLLAIERKKREDEDRDRRQRAKCRKAA